MKRLTTILMLLVVALTTAHAQFEQGTKYVGASTSGLGLSYSTSERFRLGLDANAGYFIDDCLMLHSNIGYEHTRAMDDVRIGLGARYYFDNCGIFLGAGAEYNHFTKSSNDLQIPVTIGYAYFLNDHLTIEPSVYYKMSIHDFSDNSTVGFSLGLGFYF